MKRTLAIGVGTLSLAVSSVIGFSSTAQASPGQHCTLRDYFCLYEHDDFNEGASGTVREWSRVPDGRCKRTGSPNWASSMINRSNRSVYMYDRDNCAGSHGYRARPDSHDADFTNNGWDNKTNSIK
ncbi:peptidase inhibitor family I36 protein [Streptomyces sp. CA-250714]|uniref:peptidase inhibitor family I36 protein n=1 Tax=Streptomyces sp. CA-250714 TaxID=3240060 RepID=UPI003D914CA2